MIRVMGMLTAFAISLSGVSQSGPNPQSGGKPALKPGTAYYEFEQTTARFLMNGNRAAAITGYQRVLALDPSFAPAWFNLGYIAELEKNWQEAKRDFSKYIELAPQTQDAGRARNELAVIERMSAKGFERDADYAASVQKARVFLKEGLYKEALAEAAHAQELDAARWEAYMIACIAMKKQGKETEAQQLRKLTLSRVPEAQRPTIEAAISAASTPKQ